MATLMDLLMQREARGYKPPTPPTVNVPNPMSPTDAVREQMLRQGGVIPDTPVAGGANITTRPAYSQMQSYVGGQDSPIEQLRMRGQGAMPTAAAASSLPTMMGYSPNQFGGFNVPAPETAPVVASAPVAPIQSATSTTAPAVPAAPSIFSRIFSGEDYQSNAMPVVMAPQGPGMTGAPLPQTVNWGDPENAADYFRAAAAAQRIGLL